MIEALFPGFPKIGRFCFGRSVGGAVLPQDARGPGLHPQQKEDLQQQACVSAGFLLRASGSPGRQAMRKPDLGREKEGVGRGLEAELEAMLENVNDSWKRQRHDCLGFLGCGQNCFLVASDSRLYMCTDAPCPQTPGSSLLRLHNGLILQGTQICVHSWGMVQCQRSGERQWDNDCLWRLYLVPSGAVTVLYGSCLS